MLTGDRTSFETSLSERMKGEADELMIGKAQEAFLPFYREIQGLINSGREKEAYQTLAPYLTRGENDLFKGAYAHELAPLLEKVMREKARQAETSFHEKARQGRARSELSGLTSRAEELRRLLGDGV